jgi:hypothetical protein
MHARRATAAAPALLTALLAACAGCATSGPASAQPAPTDPVRTLPWPATGTDAVPANHYDYFGGLRLDDSVPKPVDTVGHEIGERFTRHHMLLQYLTTLAASSERVRIEQYGWTHQRRPLVKVTISSPANLARLDEILAANLELTDPRETSSARAREIAANNPAIAWFSFNVHGNEASCSEAAMQLAYTLAAAQNDEALEILDKVVLVIEPMINPDGRERYVSFFDNAFGFSPNNARYTAEHDEPWPGARTNHYHFDLNRDWLWMVHPESRARIGAYSKVKPQLHIDYHEQEPSSPYFFGAGDSPYNANIPAETRRWLDVYGEANARVFDEHGLEYATRERFDYLYPGYGKVLPVYHGAIGLLTEKGGHGIAGVSINILDRYDLLLRDRVRDHFLTAMSYLETTASKRQEQLERFYRFHQEAMQLAPGEPVAYAISASTDPMLKQKVWDLLTPHGVEIHALTDDVAATGLIEYRDGAEHDQTLLPSGSWIVRVDQPMGRLVRTLFERITHVEDADTYDITAWSMPVAFGLDAYAMMQKQSLPTRRLEDWSAPLGETTGEGRVALLVDADQHLFPMAAGVAAKHDLFGRVAAEPFRVDGRDFDAGTLIFFMSRNDPNTIESFTDEINALGLHAHRASAGLPESGPAFGVNKNRYFTLPKVLLLRGSPVEGNSYGQHWHLLDLVSPVPYSAVNVDALSAVDWDDYTVLLLPEARSLSRVFDGARLDALKAWIRAGGTVVASGDSAMWASSTLLDLKPDEVKRDDKASDLTWEERRARGVDERVSGVLLRAGVDRSHPLAAGAPEWFGLIKRGTDVLPLGENGYAVARFDSPAVLSGLVNEANAKRLDGSPAITHHRMGRGSVICFADDATFRGFNHAATRLLLNAIVYGPSLGDAR